jgi:predicted RNA-binding protein YlqC (UPF0109 family)
MYSNTKKFYVDIKEGEFDKVRYLKISELSNGRRATLRVLEEDVGQVMDMLKNVEERSNTRVDSKAPRKKLYYELFTVENDLGKEPRVELSENHPDGRKHRVFIEHESVRNIVEAVETLSERHLNRASETY